MSKYIYKTEAQRQFDKVAIDIEYIKIRIKEVESEKDKNFLGWVLQEYEKIHKYWKGRLDEV
jgi:sporulation-control protein spo0M